MSDLKNRFTVITNEELIEDKAERKRDVSYHSNPMKWQSQSLREDFMRFTNEESGRKFSIEDLLR